MCKGATRRTLIHTPQFCRAQYRNVVQSVNYTGLLRVVAAAATFT